MTAVHQNSDSEYKYDVFLSHSSKDKDIVRPIADKLRGDGLRVWLDEWVIKAGNHIPSKIEEGLKTSRILVLFMSANGIGSDWAKLETGAVRFSDPLNENGRLIPIRLDDTPIEGTLDQFKYIDWHGKGPDAAYEELLAALNSHMSCQHSNVIVDNSGLEAIENGLGKSPFHPGGTMGPDEMTYIVRRCDKDIEEFSYSNAFIWLQGGFQFGKSSLLLRKDSWLGKEWLSVYSDLTICDKTTPQDFKRDLLAEFKEATEGHWVATSFDTEFSWRSLRNISHQHKLAFLIDEIGSCSTEQIKELISVFFSLWDSSRDRVLFVVSHKLGARQVLGRCGFNNPKYTEKWKTVHVDGFSTHEVRKLIEYYPGEFSSILRGFVERFGAITMFEPGRVQCLLNDIWLELERSDATPLTARNMVDEYLRKLESRVQS